MATVTVNTGATPEPAFIQPEPQSAPNKYGTDDRDLSRRRLRAVVSIILAVSLILQFIALVTPGWLIVSVESTGSLLSTTSIYGGVFYSTTCVTVEKEGQEEETCETLSRHDAHRATLKGASDARKLLLKRNYNLGAGRLQGGVVLSWLGTLSVVMVIVFIILKKKNLLHAGPILCAMLAVIGIIMGEIIHYFLVELDYLTASKLASDVDTTSIGFSFSLLFYILACIQVFASFFVVFKCFRDDLLALQAELSEKGVLLNTEKRHVEHLREKLNSATPRSSVRGSPMLRPKHPRDLRPSPRGSPRVSREVSPSPRPSPRPRDHQHFRYPSPRNSAEVRDYDRHSTRPAEGPPTNGDWSRGDRPHKAYPREGDRHRDRPRDQRDDRPRDYRDERPRDYGNDRSRDPREDQSRGQREGEILIDPSRQATTDSGEEHLRLPGFRSDYMPVADSSDSEMFPKTSSIEMTGVPKPADERTAGEVDVTDVNALAIDM